MASHYFAQCLVSCIVQSVLLLPVVSTSLSWKGMPSLWGQVHMQDLLNPGGGSPGASSPLASPKHRSSLGTPRVATQLNWFRGNSISANLSGSVSAAKLQKVLLPFSQHSLSGCQSLVARCPTFQHSLPSSTPHISCVLLLYRIVQLGIGLPCCSSVQQAAASLAGAEDVKERQEL